MTFGYAMPRGQTWTALCADRTQAVLVNRAVNGNTTGGMMAALKDELATQQPDIVMLMGGANDILYGADLNGAKSNMGGMAHIIWAAGALPVIGIPPHPQRSIRKDWAAFISKEADLLLDEYIKWLREFARVFRFPVVDFAARMPERAKAQGIQWSECYLPDGLHPNSIGHELMAQCAAEIINGLGRSRRSDDGNAIYPESKHRSLL